MPETHFIPHEQLAGLLPPSVMDNPDEAAFELVRAVLIRSTYIPGVRHRLGWCGIHEVVSPWSRPGSITAKVNDRSGVFALHPIETAPAESRSGCSSRFTMCYFPAPDEQILEQFSIEAGIAALAPDFMDRVRQFSLHPDLISLFHIGFIDCAVQDHGVFMALQASERLGWRSEKGIMVDTSGGSAQAVAPGGIDQDLPAREIAMNFFRSLVASFTYTLAFAPSIFYSQKRKSQVSLEHFHDTFEQRLTMGYFCRAEQSGDFDWQNSPVKLIWDETRPVPDSNDNELWWTPDLTGAGNSLDKKAMGITYKPRFILLTGFLGSGKTSFLDHFIQAQTASNNFVAVVQNEIGEKGLDAALLDQTYAVTQMDEGCVCCSLAGNLRAALSDILDRFQPDFIVLETTGLANPANILREIDDLDDLLEFGSITTIMDSRAGSQTLDRFEVARDQVRLADVILLNKSDLESQDHDALKDKIRRLNPSVDIHLTVHGDIHPGILYGVNFRNPVRPKMLSSIGSGVGSHATHEKDRIETRLIDLDGPLEQNNLLTAIKNGGNQVLRVKGIADFKDQCGPMVFQYAPGICQISEFSGKDAGDRFLVVIGQELEKNFDYRSMLQ
ncbi:MAG: GTP-binding protein [Desulfobacteraceae bacterium]|nr:GTP-binding protein [Desulfobacteraceae bacterium]